MREITVKLYKFNELSSEAQQVAIDALNVDDEVIGVYNEAIDSAKEFYKLFPGLVSSPRRWLEPNFGYMEDCSLNLSGLRLRTWLINNLPLYENKAMYRKGWRFVRMWKQDMTCRPFTGICWDDFLLHPIRNFVDNPTNDTTMQDIIESCFDYLRREVEDSEEYYRSDEYKREYLAGLDEEYYENGEEY